MIRILEKNHLKAVDILMKSYYNIKASEMNSEV